MRTFVPPTSFVSSPQTEKERLLYTTATLASGFFTRHGFVILPKPVDKYKSYCIIVPSEIKRVGEKYWIDANSGGNKMPKILSKHMWKETKNIILPPVEKETISKYEHDWKKIERPVWRALAKFFPSEVKWIGSLEVRITRIGSLGSHYLLSKTKGQNLIINVRHDSNYKEIINLLILSLIYPYAQDLEISFTHRQSLRNFILSRKPFRKLYPDFKAKIFDNIKVPISLKMRGEDYLLKLGVPNIINPLSVLKKNLDVFGPKEEKILSSFIKNINEVVTYDEMADIIWGESKFKSYWALNKIVQRIQKKINLLNLNIHITGVRGKGYLLKNNEYF